MAEVQVGRGRVDAELDAQRHAVGELARHVGLGTRSAMPLVMTCSCSSAGSTGVALLGWVTGWSRGPTAQRSAARGWLQFACHTSRASRTNCRRCGPTVGRACASDASVAPAAMTCSRCPRKDRTHDDAHAPAATATATTRRRAAASTVAQASRRAARPARRRAPACARGAPARSGRGPRRSRSAAAHAC